MSSTKEEVLIEQLVAIVEELGWTIIIPKNEVDEEAGPTGLIMGTTEFIETVQMHPDSVQEVLNFDTKAPKVTH